jgi:lysyl-tRNA synthetase class 2
MKQTWLKLRENPDLWDLYDVRMHVIDAIRAFFKSRNFREIETPLLTPALPQESYIEVFESTLLSRDRKKTNVYLPTSPEPFLKKLLVAGAGNCFTITKSFRNTESNSKTHTPEFTILEWYRVGASYTDIMNDLEQLILSIHTYLMQFEKYKKSSMTSASRMYQGVQVDLSVPWKRMSVREAFVTYGGVPRDCDIFSREELSTYAKSRGYHVQKTDSWEILFNQVFLNEVEPHLGQGKPVILFEYPAQLAALAKKKDSDHQVAERFEAYIEKLEIADAYSELTDWSEQKARFEQETLERARLGKTTVNTDLDFIRALQTGMPESGGIAVGVDRLVMFFADVATIHETLFFPMHEMLDSQQ